MFEAIFILCPTWKRNRTYLECSWLWRGPHASRFLFIDPGEKLHDWLRALFGVAVDTSTLYLIDDMAASKALTKKDTLSELAFIGHHVKQSLWVLVQKYNAVCKDVREQTKWVGLFHCKYRFSFTDALDENDIVPYELRALLHMRLSERKHAKLLLKTDQSTACYYIIVMVENLFSLVFQILTFCGVTYLIYFCIKLKRVLNMLLRKLTAMDCDEILAALQADDAGLACGTSMASVSPEPAHVVSATSEKLQRMRARLAALACGGQACVALGVSFKGRPLTSERVDAMEDVEIKELHARYEAQLGTAMSKS